MCGEIAARSVNIYLLINELGGLKKKTATRGHAHTQLTDPAAWHQAVMASGHRVVHCPGAETSKLKGISPPII